jgi:hypothetical protein
MFLKERRNYFSVANKPKNFFSGRAGALSVAKQRNRTDDSSQVKKRNFFFSYLNELKNNGQKYILKKRTHILEKRNFRGGQNGKEFFL